MRRAPRPNTRVQRTRSSPSALRSPLTRHPLGRGSEIVARSPHDCIGIVLRLAAIATTLVLTLACASSSRQQRVEEDFPSLEGLPTGLTVQHTPNPAHWQEHGRSGRRYTWPFTTTVTASGKESVTIIEFGSLTRVGDHWVLATFTHAPFTSKDFARWYQCPDGRVDPGHPCSDPQNWFGADSMRASELRWYYIGVTAKGQRVKGDAIVSLEATPE